MTQKKQTQNDSDCVILVDENDVVVGSADKIKAHRSPGLLHRAVSVFLFNNTGRLLIQQRSQHKIVAAYHWANTVCGNVRPNEVYLECAQRRLEEELGIVDVALKPVGKFQYRVDFENGFSEHEIDRVFAGFYNGDVKPNPKEAKDYDWIDWRLLFKDDSRQYAPWLKIILEQDEIRKKLEKIIQ